MDKENVAHLHNGWLLSSVKNNDILKSIYWQRILQAICDKAYQFKYIWKFYVLIQFEVEKFLK